jgi:hypothetical protein
VVPKPAVPDVMEDPPHKRFLDLLDLEDAECDEELERLSADLESRPPAKRVRIGREATREKMCEIATSLNKYRQDDPDGFKIVMDHAYGKKPVLVGKDPFFPVEKAPVPTLGDTYMRRLHSERAAKGV